MQAMARLQADTACRDSVLIHFSGFSLRGDEIRASHPDLGNTELARIAHPLFSDDPVSAQIEARKALLAEPYMILTEAREDSTDVISAADLAEFALRLRNREADVTVMLDTSSAEAYEIELRHARRDGRLFARENVSGGLACGADAWAPCRVEADTRLSARAGSLTILYGTFEGDYGLEQRLPVGAENPTRYGLFSYQVAEALVTAPRSTIGALARQIRRQDQTNSVRSQEYTFIATAPDLDLVVEERPPPSDDRGRIILESPEETRAAVALEEPEIMFRGRVEALGKPINVVINGIPAALDGDSGFSATIPLQAGVNTITMFASTDRNETISREFELFYQGDIRAALGEGKRYLVTIANQDYQTGSGIPDLRTPVGDAAALAEVMAQRFGYETKITLEDGNVLDLVLEDATYRDIQLMMSELEFAISEEDTLVIFYAGHGEYSEATNTGYWLPVDARSEREVTYMDAKVITDALQRIRAKNAIIISDSCYSGMLARSTGEVEAADAGAADPERLAALQRLADQRSRIVLSSGGNEPVADGGGSGHSVFARALLDTLRDPETTSFTARELHAALLGRVVLQADQTPDFRAIRGAGHEGGDVVFLAQNP